MGTGLPAQGQTVGTHTRCPALALVSATGSLARTEDVCFYHLSFSVRVPMHPDNCNNNGVCELSLTRRYHCICARGYTGPTCAERMLLLDANPNLNVASFVRLTTLIWCLPGTCPTAAPWFAEPVQTNVAHTDGEVECAGMGVCVRGTGRCLCRAGFFGTACEYCTFLSMFVWRRREVPRFDDRLVRSENGQWTAPLTMNETGVPGMVSVYLCGSSRRILGRRMALPLMSNTV